MPKNDEIIAKILTMNPDEVARFISSLSPDSLDYLEILLSKADSVKLKQYLDSK